MPKNYPAAILPDEEYLLEMDIPQLLRVYPNLYAARRIDGNRDQLVVQIDGDNVLVDAALKGINVANFSVNLVGALFDVNSHLEFRPISEEITKQWKGEKVSLEQMDNKYEIKNPCFAIYYKILDFIKYPLIQDMTFQSENDFIGFKANVVANHVEETYLNAFEKGKTIQLPVKKKVNHIPTFCNYWHIVLDTYPYERPNIPIGTSETSKPYKRILRHLRNDFLTKCGSFEIKRSYSINRCFYSKGRKNKLFRKAMLLIALLRGN